jgi:PAS domain S-box-containing protein
MGDTVGAPSSGTPISGAAGRRREIRWELNAHRAEALLQTLRETVTVLDAEGRVLYTNRAIEGILGYGLWQFDHLPLELIHPDEVDEFLRLFEQVRSTSGAQISGEFRVRGADGEWKVVEGSAVNMLSDPAIGAIVLVTRNRTDTNRPSDEARDRARRVRELSERDALTGLGTRTRFLTALRRSLERRRQTGWKVAIGLVTLGRYEVLGAAEGQAAADSLVLAAADRLTGVVPPDDPVARIEADTFAILSESEDAPADAIAIADAVASALRVPGLPHSREGVEAVVSVLVADDEEIDAETVLERAEARHRRMGIPARGGR